MGEMKMSGKLHPDSFSSLLLSMYTMFVYIQYAHLIARGSFGRLMNAHTNCYTEKAFADVCHVTAPDEALASE